jgi:cell division protein FtsB
MIEKLNVHQILDRACQIFYSSRRKLATASVLALVAFLAFHVVFGANGMVVYTQKRTEFKRLQGETEHLDEENRSLAHQVDALKTDPKAIEKEARDQLHYAKEGEIIYLLPQKPADLQADQQSKDASAKVVDPQK